MQLNELINLQPRGCVLRVQVTDEYVTLSMIRGNEQSSVKLSRQDVASNEHLIPSHIKHMADTFKTRPGTPATP